MQSVADSMLPRPHCDTGQRRALLYRLSPVRSPPILGFVGVAWNCFFGAALAGVIGADIRGVFTRMRKASTLRGSIWTITSYIAAVYFSQLVVCSALFLVGRGFGLVLTA